MEVVQKRFNILAIGFAIFSMFFGAGNMVFPLILGGYSLDNNFFGIVGMSLTAVLVPLLGMLSMILYEGDYHGFFRQIGKWPGAIIVMAILALIGPFTGIPRCITIAYATLNAFDIGQLPGINLITFSLFCCTLIFICTFRPARMLDVLGKVLTPMLLLSLAVIAVKGLLTLPKIAHCSEGAWSIFCHGFVEGYNTMDLLASFFFSSVILVCLKEGVRATDIQPKRYFSVAVFSSVIAAVLLCLVYVAFSTVAAGFQPALVGIPKHELLGTIAKQILGPYAGLIVCMAVFFAVLTTMIALTSIFAKYLQETLLKKRISYVTSILVTLVVAFAFSTLQFDGIAAFIGPILLVCYPALISLAAANLVSKLKGPNLAKPLFYGTLALTLFLKCLL